jgi:6-phosphogluconolactonase
MNIRRNRYPDSIAAAQACAREILAQIEAAVDEKNSATLAVSGGNSPVPMFQELARQRFNWDRVHLFWVDERAVPETDPQSNYKLADDYFIAPAHLPRRNVHRVETEYPPEEAARRYAEYIRNFFGLTPGDLPRFDVIHRGIGADAHTASLFPGERLIDDRDRIAAAVWVEKMSQWRITLLPGVLLRGRYTAVLASGADKAEAVQKVFSEPYDPKKYPSQLGLQDGGAVTWFLDDAAARLLD